MWIGIAVFVLMVGSVLFHLFTPWYFTPIASNWTSIDNAVDVSFWVTGAVFVAINSFMVYSVIRYGNGREAGRTTNQRARGSKNNSPCGPRLASPLLLAPGLYAWDQFVTVPEDASVFEAVGQQWQWSFRFPGKDGVLGTADVQDIGDNNPFGLNPEDPYGQDDVLVKGSTVHLPVGKPIKIVLRSKDVLHDFFVPQIRAKMNVVPGWSPISGSRRPRPERSRSCARNLRCRPLRHARHLDRRRQSTFDGWLNSSRRSRRRRQAQGEY